MVVAAASLAAWARPATTKTSAEKPPLRWVRPFVAVNGAIVAVAVAAAWLERQLRGAAPPSLARAYAACVVACACRDAAVVLFLEFATRAAAHRRRAAAAAAVRVAQALLHRRVARGAGPAGHARAVDPARGARAARRRAAAPQPGAAAPALHLSNERAAVVCRAITGVLAHSPQLRTRLGLGSVPPHAAPRVVLQRPHLVSALADHARDVPEMQHWAAILGRLHAQQRRALQLARAAGRGSRRGAGQPGRRRRRVAAPAPAAAVDEPRASPRSSADAAAPGAEEAAARLRAARAPRGRRRRALRARALADGAGAARGVAPEDAATPYADRRDYVERFSPLHRVPPGPRAGARRRGARKARALAALPARARTRPCPSGAAATRPASTSPCATSADALRALLDVVGRAPAVVDARTTDGSTPLHLAAAVGSREATEALLDAGADATARTLDGDSPLHVAAWTNALPVAEALLARGAEVDAVKRDGSTPLHLCASRGLYGMVTILLEAGADKRKTTVSGSTPADRAALFRDDRLVRSLS
ncbi:hypothetical protein JL720_1336 [Aureococcus anophagefferens]|nr:hypothetical protein JL720_1336 [Aureococcus anophagefferens]